MSIERKVRALAGTIILVSLLLSLWSSWWLLLTAFVGLNLLQSAFTAFCPAENIFRKLERSHGSTERPAK